MCHTDIFLLQAKDELPGLLHTSNSVRLPQSSSRACEKRKRAAFHQDVLGEDGFLGPALMGADLFPGRAPGARKTIDLFFVLSSFRFFNCAGEYTWKLHGSLRDSRRSEHPLCGCKHLNAAIFFNLAKRALHSSFAISLRPTEAHANYGHERSRSRAAFRILLQYSMPTRTALLRSRTERHI